MYEPERRHFLHWLPRGLSVVYLGLLVLLSMDAFQESLASREMLIALFMHLLPALIFLAAAAVAWRRPMLGGWLLLGLGVALTLFFGTYRHFWGFMVVTLPLLIMGTLFFLEGFRYSPARH